MTSNAVPHCRGPLATRVRRVGSWWSIQVGGQAIPVWGKKYLPDELMLLFADEDRFVDTAKLAAWAVDENRTADAPEPDEVPVPWHNELVGYSAAAGTLRQRLELQGFASDWVRRLSIAFTD